MNGFAVEKQGNVYGIDSAISERGSNRSINTIERINTVANIFDAFYTDFELFTYFAGIRIALFPMQIRLQEDVLCLRTKLIVEFPSLVGQHPTRLQHSE
jgi:hypothetical protein